MPKIDTFFLILRDNDCLSKPLIICNHGGQIQACGYPIVSRIASRTLRGFSLMAGLVLYAVKGNIVKVGEL